MLKMISRALFSSARNEASGWRTDCTKQSEKVIGGIHYENYLALGTPQVPIQARVINESGGAKENVMSVEVEELPISQLADFEYIKCTKTKSRGD